MPDETDATTTLNPADAAYKAVRQPHTATHTHTQTQTD
jgi:hypothetical protein